MLIPARDIMEVTDVEIESLAEEIHAALGFGRGKPAPSTPPAPSTSGTPAATGPRGTLIPLADLETDEDWAGLVEDILEALEPDR